MLDCLVFSKPQAAFRYKNPAFRQQSRNSFSILPASRAIFLSARKRRNFVAMGALSMLQSPSRFRSSQRDASAYRPAALSDRLLAAPTPALPSVGSGFRFHEISTLVTMRPVLRGNAPRHPHRCPPGIIGRLAMQHLRQEQIECPMKQIQPGQPAPSSPRPSPAQAPPDVWMGERTPLVEVMTSPHWCAFAPSGAPPVSKSGALACARPASAWLAHKRKAPFISAARTAFSPATRSWQI